MPATLAEQTVETSIHEAATHEAATASAVAPHANAHSPTCPDPSYVASEQFDDLASSCCKRSDGGGDAVEHQVSSRTRRNLLISSGIATLAGSMTALSTGAQALQAQDDRAEANTPRMRRQRGPVGSADLPALPALGVIALNRMGYGPRPGDLAAFNALGGSDEERLAAYVAQQLNPDAIDDSACDARLAAHNFLTLDKSLPQLWADHVRAAENPYKNRILPATETEQATFLRAVYSERQLQEVLVEHWFNHFNIYGWDYWTAPVMVHYDRDVIRANVLGNFRTLLGAVAKSPAMLYYLDNQSNSGGNPNENYARELFELHTMGAENYLGVVPLTINADGSFTHPAPKESTTGKPLLYVDADVYGATTCFTGWRIDKETGLFAFDDGAHFPYQKVVLGRLIPEAQGIRDGEDVLDLVATHPGTARYLCRKLCRRLIHDEPPERIVQAAAAVFLANVNAPDQLRKVTETILLSAEFRTTWGEKIKRPFEYAVSVLRAAQANFTPNSTFLYNYDSGGQPLFSWSPPNGYPDDRATWSGTMPLLQRWRLVHFLVEWAVGGEGADKDDLRLSFTTPADLQRPNAILTYWADRLLGRPLPATEHAHIVAFLANGRNPDLPLPAEHLTERLSPTLALLFMSPSFQWR